MKSLFRVFYLFCLITPLFSQNSVSVSLDRDYYPSQNNFNPTSGISVSVLHFFGSLGELGVKYSYNTTSINIQSPSQNYSVAVNASDFYLVYGFISIYPVLSMEVKPVIGFGFKSLARDAYTIDLGALGNTRNPETRTNYFSSFIGIKVIKNLTANIGFFIEPGLAVYDSNSLNKIFSIKGGVQLAVP